MTTRPVVHGSFTIERTYQAPVTRVYAAWADLETKARWFIGPPERWQLVQRELDFRVGGRELLRGQLAGGRATLFTASYHAIVPNERLIYAYDMHVDAQHLSVSLATVEFAATSAGGTRMTFTEQAAFLDGEDGPRSRERGTDEHFERLGAVLADPHEIVSARVFDVPRERLYQAFAEPERLQRWWGPKGFGNEFSVFELRPGGAWKFVMLAPDGSRHVMEKTFVEVLPNERVVLQHEQPPSHRFLMTITFTDLGPRTYLVWRMRFESAEEATAVRAIVAEANEQNFDRLAAELEA